MAVLDEQASDGPADVWLSASTTREVVTLLLAVIVLFAGYAWLLYEGSRPVVPPMARATPVTTPVKP